MVDGRSRDQPPPTSEGSVIEDVYELSPTQEGMLFHGLEGESSGVDLEQVIADLPEALEESAFLEAWQQVIARHPILRTAFRWDGPEGPRQEVHRQAALTCRRHDWSDAHHRGTRSAAGGPPRGGPAGRHRPLSRPPAAPHPDPGCSRVSPLRLDLPPRPSRRAVVPDRPARGVRGLRGDSRRWLLECHSVAALLPRLHRLAATPRAGGRRALLPEDARGLPRPHSDRHRPRRVEDHARRRRGQRRDSPPSARKPSARSPPRTR